MSQISLQIPQVNQPDATEDPKVASDFTAIQNAINGGLDSSNLAANPGIALAESGLAAAIPAPSSLGALFYATDTGAISFDTTAVWLPLNLVPAASAINATVKAGQFLNMTGANTLATLPSSPPVGTICGVKAGSTIVGSGPVTVGAGAPLIVYPGAGGVATASVALGMSHSWVVLLWNGTVWAVIAGAPDTGYVALTLGTNVSAGDATTPAARLIGSRVYLQGALVTTGAIAGSAAIATIPTGSGLRPASSLVLPLLATGSSAPSPPVQFTVTSAGKISTTTAMSSAPVSIALYGVSFDLAS